VKKPLVALVLVSAALATLVVPAGAATTVQKNKDWTVIELPCRIGHKHATIGFSPTHPWWLPDPEGGDGGIRNPHGWQSWYSNPCKGQWLLMHAWEGDPSEDSNMVWSAGTGTSGKVFDVTGGELADAAYCPEDVGFDFTSIVRPGQVQPC